MRALKPQKLSLEAFEKYGRFHSMIDPRAERLGPPPVEFYRDILKVPLGAGVPALSVTRVCPRPAVVEKYEYHSSTAEAFMPIDGDVVIHVAPAGKKEPVPYDRTELFLVPKGTAVVIDAGVWHGAPFACGGEAVNVLVVLPERAYANDCQMFLFPDEQKIKIEG